MSELKPCDACDNKPVIKKLFIHGIANRVNYFAQCQCGRRTRYRNRYDGAVDEWNENIYVYKHPLSEVKDE